MIVTQVTRIGHINKTIINSKIPANVSNAVLKEHWNEKKKCDMTSFTSYLANQLAVHFVFRVERVLTSLSSCILLCDILLMFHQDDDGNDDEDSILQRYTMNIPNIVYYI